MDVLFGASIQVVALVISIVCLISAILGKSYGIGPVQVPAPSDLLPRVALAVLGTFLLTVAFWDKFAGGKTLIEIAIAWFSPPQPFTTNNDALLMVLKSGNASLITVRLDADTAYLEAPGVKQRCSVASELVDVYPKTPDAYPLVVLTDAGKFSKGTNDARALELCAPQMKSIASLFDGVESAVSATAPTQSKAVSASAVVRPRPAIATTNGLAEDVARRVLTAATLPADRGWMFIGFRGLDRRR